MSRSNTSAITPAQVVSVPDEPQDLDALRLALSDAAASFVGSLKLTAGKYWEVGTRAIAVRNAYEIHNRGKRGRQRITFTPYLETVAKEHGVSSRTMWNAIHVAESFPTAAAAAEKTVSEAIGKPNAKGLTYSGEHPENSKPAKPKPKNDPEPETTAAAATSNNDPEPEPASVLVINQDHAGEPGEPASVLVAHQDQDGDVFLAFVELARSLKSRDGVPLAQIEDAVAYLRALPE